MANALTAVRLLLVVPFAMLVGRGDARVGTLAALLILVAIGTDLLDGRVARRLGTVSAFGGTFDHTADFLFVTCGLFASAFRGTVPWLLPSLITAAFTQYVVDSYWIHRGQALRGSRLGRYNGILYFVPLCVNVGIDMGLHALRPLLAGLAWTLVLSTAISMGQRFRSAGRARALPAAETRGQSPR
jgi:CDP-diacylglycerol--glycerol-3-phosphate 3-phosphatidyltransferase